MNALFDALDHFSGVDYIVAALVAGAGLTWIVQILSETSAHRSWAQRQSDFADSHPRERVGAPLAGATSARPPVGRGLRRDLSTPSTDRSRRR